MRLAPLLILLVLLALPGPATASDRAPRVAIEAAKDRAERHYRTSSRVKATFSIRSEMDRRWALVTGEGPRRTIWAAWLRRNSAGRWRVAIFTRRAFDPGTRVPCDVRPAFSEPIC